MARTSAKSLRYPRPDDWFAPPAIPPAVASATFAALGVLAGAGIVLAVRYGPMWLAAAALVTLLPAALLIGTRRFLLAAILIDIPFQIDVHLAYREELAQLGTLGGYNVSVTTFALAGLYLLWIYEALGSPGVIPRPRFKETWAPALILAGCALSLLNAAQPQLALMEIWLLFQLYLLFLYIVSRVDSRAEIRFVLLVLFGGLLLQSLLILQSGFTRSTFDLGVISTAVDPSYQTGLIWRAGGTLGSPISAAGYLGLLIAPTLALAVTSRGKRWRQLGWAAATAGALAMLVTLSRGGWLTLGLSLLLFIAVGRRRALLPTWLPTAGLVLGVLCLPLFALAMDTRLSTGDAGSSSVRPVHYQLAGEIIARQPLLGVGANNFAAVLPEHAGPRYSQEWLYTIHNKFLLIWAESGVLALIGFVALQVTGIAAGFSAAANRGRLLGSLGLAFGLAILAQVPHMAVDMFHARPETQLLWTVVALNIVLARRPATDAETAQQ